MNTVYHVLVVVGLAQFAFTTFVGVLWLRFRAEQRRAVAFDVAWEQTARMLGARGGSR